MKQQVNLSQSQQLSLTPQLRQSLHLLQLSALELEAEVAQAIENNPLLDWLEGDELGTSEARESADADVRDPEPAREDGEAGDLGDVEWKLDERDVVGQWTPGDDDDEDPRFNRAAQESLHEHLRWQLHLSPLDARAQAIGVALIDAIDDDGYLRDSLDAIAEALRPDINAGNDEITAVLAQVQRFDPPGVGARDLGECLSLQLRMLTASRERDLALDLCGPQLERLPKLGIDGAARLLGCNSGEATAAIALLRSLDPKPGAVMALLEQDTYVIPDAVIWRDRGVWNVALTGNSVPRIGIHEGYVRMIRRASRDDASYLRGQLQEARWLLKGIRARGETLLNVVRCLAREQSGFLEFGEQALRPLTLREVSVKLGLHESTISRAIARKHVRTPRGTLSLRAFFASGIDTGAGGEASSAAIQSMLRQLIAAEDPRKPLSDAALADKLKQSGIPVARRTIAKYRDLLRIPPSNERVRMN
ncbi:MAG: RNA polymerase factor sigma-54 [Xanthomonadales bacterium]|nr:RNA polymerase factor sigma-54 [Xanthomonadales bacterium]